MHLLSVLLLLLAFLQTILSANPPKFIILANNFVSKKSLDIQSGCKAVNDFGCKIILIDISTAKGAINATLLENPDHVFLAPGLAGIAKNLASAFSNITITSFDDETSTAPNLQFVQFAEDELGVFLVDIGYLAGSFAALLTKSKSVAIVTDSPDFSASCFRYRNGFRNGVLSVCPTCNIHHRFLYAFGAGKNVIEIDKMLASNPFDVIAGNDFIANIEALNYSSSIGIQTIGINHDFASTNVSLTGGINNKYDVATVKIATDKMRGFFSSGIILMNSAYGAIQLSSKITTSLNAVTSRPRTVKGCTTYSNIIKSQYLFAIYTQVRTNILDIGVDYVTGFLNERSPNLSSDLVHSLTPFGNRPPERKEHTFTFISDAKFYLFGGFANGQLVSNLLYSFDYALYVWALINSPTASPEARAGHFSLYYGVSFYVLGGYNTTSTLCNGYSFKSGNWTLENNINLCLSRSAYSLIGSNLYIYGGINAQNKTINLLQILNMNTFNLITVNATGSIPESMHSSMMTKFNSTHLALFGGNRGNNNYSNILYLFDTVKLIWSKVSPSKISPPGLANGFITMLDDHRLLIIGGRGSNGASSSAIVWNSFFNIWIWNKEKINPITSFSASVFNADDEDCKMKTIFAPVICASEPRRMVLLHGGIDKNTITNSLYIYYIGSDTYTPLNCSIGEYETINDNNVELCLRCPKGTYSFSNSAHCAPCPYNGICNGGSNLLVASGSWRDVITTIKKSNATSLLDSNKAYIYDCPYDTCCQSSSGCNSTAHCKEGITGSLCSECIKPDHYSIVSLILVWGTDCVYCKYASAGYFLIIILGITAIVLLYSLVTPEESALTSNVSFCLQVISTLISSGTIQFYVAAVSSLDPFLLLNSPTIIDKCLAPLGGLGYGFLKVALPFTAMFIYFIILFGVWAWKRQIDKGSKLFIMMDSKFPKWIRERTLNQYKQCGIGLWLMVFMPLLNSTMVFFKCKSITVGGEAKSVLFEYPDVVCWKDNHIIAVVINGLLLLFFGFIGPVLFLQKVFYNQKLKDQTKNSLLFLSAPYKKNLFFWIFVEYFQRILFSLTNAITISDEVWNKWALLCCILVGLVLQKVNAYVDDKENWTLLILVCAMIGNSALSILQQYQCEEASICASNMERYAIWQLFWILIPVAVFVFRIILYLRNNRHKIRESISRVSSRLSRKASDQALRTSEQKPKSDSHIKSKASFKIETSKEDIIDEARRSKTVAKKEIEDV